MVWLEPHRVHAGGREVALSGPPGTDALLLALGGLPPGPARWVADDTWIPSLLLRDVAELPAGAEAREAFFAWRFSQSLALEAPQAVQAFPLGGGDWLLAGLARDTREAWIHASMALGRPMRSLQPRWLWLYNRLAPTRELPGMLLSLCPAGDGAYTGTLAAWGQTLTLLRQWAEPAAPGTWVQERVLPSAAWLHRESRSPHELLVWGAPQWPDCGLTCRILDPAIPAREDC